MALILTRAIWVATAVNQMNDSWKKKKKKALAIKNPIDKRNISKKYKILKCVITFLQLPGKLSFLSVVLKKNRKTIPREHMITLSLFPYCIFKYLHLTD